MPKAIQLNLTRPSTHYSIEMGEGIYEQATNLIKARLSLGEVLPRLFVITHYNLSTFYGLKLKQYLEDAGFNVHIECVNNGEPVKTWASAERLLQKMIDLKLDGSSVVVALGGGVIGDLAGFVASIYHRGLRFIQLPTSLLAMVDSSVGGKVAVNLGLAGKNLIGSFHQPSLVLADLKTLETLPTIEWKYGLSEVVKYAFLKEDNGDFYRWLSENRESILEKKELSIIEQMIYQCVQAKAELVSQDELDKKGKRALLSLGHTFGHSLEAASRYQIAHGEAVAIGITLAARLAACLGKMSAAQSGQIIKLIKDFGLSEHIDKRYGFSPAELIRHFKHDKKTEGGVVKFIVPSLSIGHCEVVHNVSEDTLVEVFNQAIY